MVAFRPIDPADRFGNMFGPTRADNAYDAKQKAWHAFLDQNHKVLPVDELPVGEWALKRKT
jgi:hypothetical protein